MVIVGVIAAILVHEFDKCQGVEILKTLHQVEKHFLLIEKTGVIRFRTRY